MSLKLSQGPSLVIETKECDPDLVSVTSYGLPVLISMTSLGLPDLISMTSLGLPNLVSVTIGTRIFKKKFKKGVKTIFLKIFTMFIVILRCFYIIYVEMSRQCRVPLKLKKNQDCLSFVHVVQHLS